MSAVWTDAHIDTMRLMRAGGFSYGDIQKALGAFSRSAVIAKAHRIGLGGDIKIRRPPPPKPKPHKPPAQRIKLKNLELSIAVDLPADTSPFACTIDALTDVSCRWPLGDPSWDMSYCGAETDGTSFCARHHRIAYHKPSKRHP